MPADRRKVRGVRAWLVTWDGVGAHAEVAEHERIVAILNPRLSPRTVRDIVTQLYLNSKMSLSERIEYALHPRRNPYPAQDYGYGQVECGHNPTLYARIVSDLYVPNPPSGDTAVWTEPVIKRRPIP